MAKGNDRYPEILEAGQTVEYDVTYVERLMKFAARNMIVVGSAAENSGTP
jgi:hypothetical protein